MFFPLRDYNPTRRTAVVTILLIAVNAGVFLYQNVLAAKPPEYYFFSRALVPWEITHFQNARLPVQNRAGRVVGYFPREVSPAGTLIYSLFMHGGLLHIIGNMLFLWIFGNNIEDRLGRLRYILFYFLCGFGSSLVHVLTHPNSLIPVIGASGAVSGVMGAYLVLYPRARIRSLVFLFILVTFVDVPAAFFLIFWFLYQFAYAGSGGGIAWTAHVGGFLIGFVLIRLMLPPRPAIELVNGGDDEEEPEDGSGDTVN